MLICIMLIIIFIPLYYGYISAFDRVEENGNVENVKEGINIIKKLEKKNVSKSQDEINKVQASLNVNNYQENINVYNNQEDKQVDFSKKFSNSVILGDSRAETIVLCNVLDRSKVVAYKGRNVLTAQSQGDIDTAINLVPQNVFITYGMNDVEQFSKSSDFINQYKKIIKKIQNRLPDANIYINSIFEVGPKALAQNPAYRKIPKYNEALKKMCDDTGTTYIDGSYIVEDKYYEPDDVHFIGSFNSRWLNLLIEKANL